VTGEPDGALPEHLTGVELERWIAILSSPGARRYPGTCTRRGCNRTRASDGLCMACLLARGGARRLR
jgi:hypothetical protein